MTRRNAKNSWKVFLLSAAFLFTGCTGSEEESPVPIRLTAESTSLSTGSRGAGVISPGSAFNPTFIASLTENDFTTTRVEWSDPAKVDAQGKVTFQGTHPYPAFGEWIYITGVHPQATPSQGKVTYTLDGTTDVMYAPALKGNKWDSNRFAGNTLSRYDRAFCFIHLLTQLQVKAKKQNADGLAFTIKKITVKGINGTLSVTLADGTTTFGNGNTDIAVSGDAISKTPVTGTEAVPIANLLLPPSEAGSFTLDIETSAGTFKDVKVSIDKKDTGSGDLPEEEKGFLAGYAHEIMLTIHDSELGVKVSIAQWKTTEGGNMDLVD